MTNLTNYDYDIFLSHNHIDQDWTAKLAQRLETEDWQSRKLRVFFSPWDIRPGQSIPKEIEKALPKSRKVGIILSPDAVNSAWVELERLVTTYISISSRDERLIPLYRRDCEIPPLLQPILGIDFRNDATFEENYRKLLAVIKDEPLPRGSRNQPDHLPLSAAIPRPPIVGFVVRRDSEGRNIVERLKEELAPERNQLIVLSGPGGVGKTTLAAEAARELSKFFSSRIVWIGALGREDFSFSTLLDEIATQLDHASLRTLAPEPKAEQVQALIASVTPLIIIDNFETIATAEQKHCVEFLLNRASCPALITTRQKITDARNIVIAVMLPEEADDFLNRLIEQASDPSSFEGLDRNRVMQASDRNPLVMQWIISQIDLAQEANTVLDELAEGSGDIAQRVFDRSFRLEWLGDDGRATLLALSLFAPDASRPALAEVAGFDEDLNRLNEAIKRLAGLYLIKLAAGQRLTVEGLTRELAKSRLLKDEHGSEYSLRFVAYFVRYAEVHAQPTAENYDVLEAEKANLLGAMDVAFDLREWESVQRVADVIASPYGTLAVRGYWNEAIQRGQQALQAARLNKKEWSIAQFAGNTAIIRQQRGEYDEARQELSEALAAFRILRSDENIAVALHQLAMLAQNQGDLHEAEQLYNESLEIKKKLGNQSLIASTLHQMGRLADEKGELDEAQRFYNESLEIKRKVGNQKGIATGLHQLAILAHKRGERDEARRLYHESLSIARRLGDQNGIAISLYQLARLAHEQGELDEARRLCNESFEISKKLGDQSGVASCLHQFGRLAEDEGNNAEAIRFFEEALAIFEKLKSPDAEIARRNLARVQGKGKKGSKKSKKGSK